eukprot:CAMPEP_0167769170 /NCGR_PEP_ID=MMETSP0110_2-20121227/17143_1 /TAXON_ID=629695 /ORGANISM="Gymnochlora sp., Strain CCMP2014" /LENGTH=771 /DNA_ID=CAMNT_0007658063 /DNA_START=604 /DNA_END=2919 /DNA_ORIENTATION=-
MDHFARSLQRPRMNNQVVTLKARRDRGGLVGFRLDKATLRIVSVSNSSSGAIVGMQILRIDGQPVTAWADYERMAKTKENFTLTVQYPRLAFVDSRMCTLASQQTQSLIKLIRNCILDWHDTLRSELKHIFHKSILKYLCREADMRITPSLIYLNRTAFRKVDVTYNIRIKNLLESLAEAAVTENPIVAEESKRISPDLNKKGFPWVPMSYRISNALEISSNRTSVVDVDKSQRSSTPVRAEKGNHKIEDPNKELGSESPQQVSVTSSSSQLMIENSANDNLNSEFRRAAKIIKETLVKDRWFRFRKYRECFVASDAVSLLKDEGFCKTTQDAVFFGEKMRKAGYLRHVTNPSKKFNFEYLFFCITLPQTDRKSMGRQVDAPSNFAPAPPIASKRSFRAARPPRAIDAIEVAFGSSDVPNMPPQKVRSSSWTIFSSTPKNTPTVQQSPNTVMASPASSSTIKTVSLPPPSIARDGTPSNKVESKSRKKRSSSIAPYSIGPPRLKTPSPKSAFAPGIGCLDWEKLTDVTQHHSHLDLPTTPQSQISADTARDSLESTKKNPNTSNEKNRKDAAANPLESPESPTDEGLNRSTSSPGSPTSIPVHLPVESMSEIDTSQSIKSEDKRNMFEWDKKQARDIVTVLTDIHRRFQEKGVLDHLKRLSADGTVEGKIRAIHQTCSTMPDAIHPRMTAEDLICGMSVALALVRPKSLRSEMNVIKLMQPILLPKCSKDQRGFCLTTFLCAAEFLENISVKDFVDVVNTLDSKIRKNAQT